MILLLGASGYVGQAFQRLFQRRGIVHRPLSRREMDYSRTGALSALLKESGVTFLINCAGYTGKPNVDACELHKTECLAGNAVLPGIIAEACAEAGIPWGHVSSGCIFTGSRPDGGGFTEDDAPNFSFRTNNGSFYSGTKALGEEILGFTPSANPQSPIPNTYIWRLRIPFNEIDHARNYLTKLMTYEKIMDARNSLSQLDEFVRACWECREKQVPFGLYNVTNPGSVTATEVIGLIQKYGVCRKEYQFFRDEAEFMALAAKTPRSNCVMDSSKLLQTGIQLTEIHDALDRALRSWQTATPR